MPEARFKITWHSRAERADRAKNIQVSKPDLQRLATSHREAGNGMTLTPSRNAIPTFNHGNYILKQIFLELPGVVPGAAAEGNRVTKGREEDHLADVFIGEEIVDREIGAYCGGR